MYSPTLRVSDFEQLPIRAQVALIEGLLELLVTADVASLAHRPAPALYASGVRYEREPGDRDEWQDVADTLERGSGDCEDLAAWRVAELRIAGEAGARCVVVPWVNDGRRDFHVRVLRADGTQEDPSIVLGMGR